MDILSALAPRGPLVWSASGDRLGKRARMGAATFNVARVAPDASRQSGRLYRAFASGGGVVVNEDLAQALSSRGFSVQGAVLSAQEQDQIAPLMSNIASFDAVWIVTCEDEAGVNLGICGPPPGLQEADAMKAIEDGEIDAKDMAAVTAWYPRDKIGGIRAFLSPLSGYTQAQFAAAIRAVEHYDEIAALVVSIEGKASDSGLPLTEDGEFSVVSARAYLAEFAQPVSMFRERFPEFVGPAVTPPSAKFGELVWMTATMIKITIVAVFALTIIAAVVLLAALGNRKFDQYAKLKQTHLDQQQQIIDCVSDPSLAPAQRRECRKALRQHGKGAPEVPSDPLESVAQAIMGLGPVLAIGAVAYFFGPVIVELVKSTSEGVRERRQAKKITVMTQGSGARVVGP